MLALNSPRSKLLQGCHRCKISGAFFDGKILSEGAMRTAYGVNQTEQLQND